jgi:UDP-N-acetylmuramoyl-tripeptide--D-alanyl-D-alanine ligase
MSILWTTQDLVAATRGLARAPITARGISIDTRTLKPGDLFVALVGENGDGHDHVAAALAKGAAGALIHRLPDGVADDAKLLQVADTLEGLTALAHFARARFGGLLVAVTGSVGKTTTKEMLRTILSAQGKTWAAEASHNNHWGVPLTLARMPPDARFAVAEIGMNHAGEIAPLARLARPDVAVVTAIAPAHIGYLGSIEAIADEKISIVAGLEAGGTVVLPGDTPLLARLLAATKDHEVRLFAEAASENASACLLSAAADADGTDVVATIGDQRLTFRLGAPGRHMAMNAVAALTAAAALGADPVRGAQSLNGFAPISGRGARRTVSVNGGTATLLDESYNASSASVRAALGVLAVQPARRRVAVLGDMLELGEHGAAEHTSLAPDVEQSADILFTCGTLMRLLHEAIAPAKRGIHAADSAALAPIVAATLRADDAVLVKGSLGSRMKLVVDAIEREAA